MQSVKTDYNLKTKRLGGIKNNKEYNDFILEYIIIKGNLPLMMLNTEKEGSRNRYKLTLPKSK